MMELLRSLHVHNLKDEEILLLKDPKRPFERKDSVSQVFLFVYCSRIFESICLFYVFNLISGVRHCFVWVSKFVVFFCVKLNLNRTNLVKGSNVVRFCTLSITSNHKCFPDITRGCMFSFTHVGEN